MFRKDPPPSGAVISPQWFWLMPSPGPDLKKTFRNVWNLGDQPPPVEPFPEVFFFPLKICFKTFGISAGEMAQEVMTRASNLANPG